MKKITLFLAALLISMTAFSAKLYLTPNANWKKDNARFAAYFFGNGDKWVSMTKVEGETDLYEVEAPAGYPSVIFCRMNPSASVNNWDNKWNQTADLQVPTNSQNHYTVKEGTWDKGGGAWTVYAPEAPKTYKDITITIIANAQPKIHYWDGGDKMVGSDWESKPDMIATTEANTYSYTIKDVDAATGVKYLIVVGDFQSVDLHTIDNVTANFKECLPQVAVMGVRNWDGTDKMVVADDYKTASITLNLTVKDYAWKLTVNGEWFGGSKYVITRDKNSLNVTDDAGGDGKLTADIAGEYVFTYTYATKNLTVTYPSNSVEPDPEPTTYAVKFDNTNSGWEKVYAYCWNGEGESVVANAAWPGVELTNPENNVYTYSTPTAYENVIFNAGEGKPQTADLAFENGKTYSIDVVYVLGTVNYERIANNECWSVDFAEHKMTYDANTGIWTKTYTDLPAGDYEFKLYCGVWLNSVVVDSVKSTPGFKYDNLGDNVSFTLSDATTVTITYNSMLNTFAIVGQGIDEFGELVVISYTLCGSKAIFGGEKDFDETLIENDMTEQDGVWTKTYEGVQLEAYNEETEEGVRYEYKVAANHKWNNGAAYPSAGGYVVFWVAEAGKYNLTFTYNPKAEDFKLSHIAEKVNEGTTTGVENAIVANVYTQNGLVVAEGEFQIFSVTGQNVTDMNGNLANGVYVVRTANTIVKVVVK